MRRAVALGCVLVVVGCQKKDDGGAASKSSAAATTAAPTAAAASASAPAKGDEPKGVVAAKGGAQEQNDNAFGAALGEDDEGVGAACASCNVKGTACVNAVCRLSAKAYWRISPTRVERPKGFRDDDYFRVCIKPSNEHTWTCTQDVTGGKGTVHYLTKSETFAIDLTTEDIQQTGIDIRVWAATGNDDEASVVYRKKIVHKPLRASDTLFKGGLRYGLDAGGFGSLLLKFEPSDGSLHPSETDDPDPEPAPKEKPAATDPTPAPKPTVEPTITKPPAWAGLACGATKGTCDHPKYKFQPFELPFADPHQGTAQVHSRPFYAVILGSVPAKSDDGDPNKACGGQFSEGDRANHQARFPNHKVFTSRNGCSNERVSYTNVNPRFNFLAVYGGATVKDGEAMLKYVKSLGKYDGPNLREMQVQLRY
jgi:hypothetical protein